MTTKEYLEQAKALKHWMDRKQDEITILQSIAERATSATDALRSSGTPSHSRLEDAVIRLMETKDQLAVFMEEYAEKYREIQQTIDRVDNGLWRDVLSLRYLSFHKWEDIADKIQRTEYHVTHRLHKKALDAVERLRSAGPVGRDCCSDGAAG